MQNRARRLVQAASRGRLLILGAGESSIRLSPPLVITRGQADFAMDTIEQCLACIIHE